MKAVDFDPSGDVTSLHVTSVPEPEVRPGDLLVRVRAAGVNRADILQRRGLYRNGPAYGDSTLLGLEIAGDVLATGGAVSEFAPGDRVMGVVGGGGYAELARIDQRMAMPIPFGLDFVSAAALPEAFITAHEALFHLGALVSGGSVLIHAAGSGVGTAAVQLARRAGAMSVGTAGADEKVARILALGANACVNYATHDFVEEALRATGGRGVEVVLDFVGAPNLERNFAALAPGGRLVSIGLLGGKDARLPLDVLMAKYLRIIGTVMRSRPLADKQAMTQRFAQRWLGYFPEGLLRPVIDSTFPLEAASEAHRRMEANLNFGKIVLTP
jgi:NADPH2:quinone reductase